MKPIKFVMAAAGVLGLLAIFLPYISVEGLSLKYWDFRQMPSSITAGLLNGPNQVYVALVGFLVVAAAGASGIVGKRLGRGAAIAGALGSLVAFAAQGVHKGMSGAEGVSTAIGGKLLFLAAVVGLLAAIIGAVKREPAA
jgi:hypothetical protein